MFLAHGADMDVNIQAYHARIGNFMMRIIKKGTIAVGEDVAMKPNLGPGTGGNCC
jgi:hypothetical protein